MATWPESSPSPVYPLVVTPRFLTSIQPLGGAADQARAEWVYPKFDVKVPYKAVSAAEVQALWDFHIARKGAYEPFYIYDLALLAGITPTHSGMFVAVADGSLDTFDIPGRNTSAQTVYVDNVEETGVSILTGGGGGSSDRIEFTAAPGAGSVITVDFTGWLRMHVRMALDTFDRELFLRSFFQNNQSIKMRGAAPV